MTGLGDSDRCPPEGCPICPLGKGAACRSQSNPRYRVLLEQAIESGDAAEVAIRRETILARAEGRPTDYAKARRDAVGGLGVVPPPYASPDRWLAPARDAGHAAGASVGLASKPWRGVARRKPWEYRVAAVLPHLDTPDLLRVAIDGLRLQGERPYILVIDGGSLSRHQADLDALEAGSDDVEVHRLRFRGFRSCNWGVAAAMDLAFAACRSEFLLSQHTDAFLRRRDVVSELASLCGPKTPAVGWRMSERDSMAPHSRGLWRGMLGHSLSIYHMPTMRAVGARWNLQWAYEALGLSPEAHEFAWPDTEVGLGLSLAAAGIGFRTASGTSPGPDDPPSVLALGDELNRSHGDGRYWHVRGTLGHRLYHPSAASSRREEVDRELAAARDRHAAWRAEDEQKARRPSPNRIAAEVESCPHRVGRWCCAEPIVHCLLGRGDAGLVERRHCHECVAAGLNKVPPTAEGGSAGVGLRGR